MDLVAAVCVALLAVKWTLPLAQSAAMHLSELRAAAVNVQVGLLFDPFSNGQREGVGQVSILRRIISFFRHPRRRYIAAS